MPEDASSSISKAFYVQNFLRLDTCRSPSDLHNIAGSLMFQSTLFKNVKMRH